jgi:hypothetical protein
MESHLRSGLLGFFLDGLLLSGHVNQTTLGPLIDKSGADAGDGDAFPCVPR